ncbi:hypothetical protein LP43_1330 [Methylophaga thiooxydans]|uniref:HEPN/Toprim N-terminal domain-containing protein n=1 Tax=Methylophaga thiooxydans TaxID=392484 RepID=A0A0A0BE84_9GAMM|nr:HEPN/Toprim-associated domain-containing protein [Methylophaga thiooxydans]KGM06838.1 hypothetical protein LP43_1330 [Methylophaga thiooxydans]
MGTYTELYIADFPVHSTKSAVDSTVMSIFRESDKIIEERPVSARNKLMWSEAADTEEKETVVEYSATVEQVIDRLNIMGFTINASKAWFELGIKEKLETYKEWASDGDSGWIQPQIDLLETFTFEKYVEALSKVYEKKLVRWTSKEDLPEDADPVTQFIYDDQDYEMYFGYPAYDIRHFLRVFLEIVPKSKLVVQDVTDLVEGGYYDITEHICEGAIEELIGDYLVDSKVLILTEGSTDKNFLEPALKLLYPHLADYFSFMDFGVSKAAGGASALVTTIKAFIGAGIGNRVVALFDNDTAAKVALKALKDVDIPNTIKVVHYPEIEICNDYPTIGPSGLSNLNINGLAGSIEVYLGIDTLEIDGELTPVQWKGYESSLKQYQGEIVDKGEVQKRYLEKVRICQQDPANILKSDWNGIRAIFKAVFDCFEEYLPNKSMHSDSLKLAGD